MLTKLLDLQHPDYAKYKDLWSDVELIVKGGQALAKAAERFLWRKPAELATVYAARCEQFAPQSIVGTAVGWYEQAMFGNQPAVASGDPKETAVTPAKAPKDFLTTFFAGCDAGRKVKLVDMFRQVFRGMLMYRCYHVLVDLPRTVGEVTSRADQRAKGGLDPFLVPYEPCQVINWSKDASGAYEWVVIATTEVQTKFGAAATSVDRWYHFDRTTVTIYEAERKEGKKVDEAAEVHSGPHAMADNDRVPLLTFEVPDLLWLCDRVYPQSVAHMNADAVLGWALFMAALPVPVITGDFKAAPVASETSFIQLGDGGKFEFAEPSGSSFEHLKLRVDGLMQEVHRQMYLLSQARTDSSTAAAASGLSKQIDMQPADDVLAGLGGILSAAIEETCNAVAAVRGDAGAFTVRGFDDFADPDTSGELDNCQKSLDLGIPSETIRKALYKRAARAALPGESEETFTKGDKEIDASPSQEEIDAKAQAAQADRFKKSLTSAVGPTDSTT